MQIPGPQARPTDSESLGLELQDLHFNKRSLSLKHTKVREPLPGYCFPNQSHWNLWQSTLKIQLWMTPKDSDPLGRTWPRDPYFKCPGKYSGNQWLPLCTWYPHAGNPEEMAALSFHSPSSLLIHWVNLRLSYPLIIHQYGEVWCESTKGLCLLEVEYFNVCDKHWKWW